MHIKIFLIVFLIFNFTLFSCKDDEFTVEQEQIDPDEPVKVTDRIEFSQNNIIPNSLRLLSYNNTIDVNPNESLELTSHPLGVEVLVQQQNDVLFLRRNLPNESNVLNAQSTSLFLTTLNDEFKVSTNSQKINYLNQIKTNEFYLEALEIFRNQQNPNIFSDAYKSLITKIVDEIYLVDLVQDIEADSYEPASVIFNDNENTFTVENLTNVHLGYGIYDNELLIDLKTIKPKSTSKIELPTSDKEYTIRVMTGEDTATDIFGLNELEEIEAFNADMYQFLYDSAFQLFDIKDLIPEGCFKAVFEQLYGNYNFASELQESENVTSAVLKSLKLFEINFVDVLKTVDECGIEDIDSTIFENVEFVFNTISKFLNASDAGKFLGKIAVQIQDYKIYKNLQNFCIISDGQNINSCDNYTAPDFALAEYEIEQNFSSVIITETKTNILTIINIGNFLLEISNLETTEGFDANYSGTIQPNETKEIEVTFSPTEEREYVGELKIFSNVESGVETLVLSGEGIRNSGNIKEGDVYLLNQNEVDEFVSNNYSEINGLLNINSSNSITDLSGLKTLKRISKHLNILNLKTQTDLSFLSGLEYCTDIRIELTENLKSLSGIENLKDINHIYLFRNASLEDIDAISNSFANNMNYLDVYDNDKLLDLDAFNSVNSYTGQSMRISFNDNLSNLCGIKNMLANNLPNNFSYVSQGNGFNPTEQEIVDGNCSN